MLILYPATLLKLLSILVLFFLTKFLSFSKVDPYVIYKQVVLFLSSQLYPLKKISVSSLITLARTSDTMLIAMVRADNIVFLILGGEHSVFQMKFGVSCSFVDVLYEIVEVLP